MSHFKPTLIACIFLTIVLTTGVAQHEREAWKQVGPNLYKRTMHQAGLYSVEYRGRGILSDLALARIIQAKHPKDADFFYKIANGPAFLVRAQSGTCTGSGSGFDGIEQAQAMLTVSCSSALALGGQITLFPALGGGLTEKSKNYTGTGTLNEILEEQQNCTQKINCYPLNPTSWQNTESWNASDGESGYYCQSGDSTCG